jgi:MFS family permease
VSERATARQRATLLAVCVGQGMILLDVTIANVALPSIQRELGVTPANLEWVINAYALALASLLLVGGTLGDRYGRKRLFVIGLALFTLFSAACALAQDDPELIAFRVLQGAGAALMAPLTLAILVDAFPAERRTAAIGIWAGVAGLGFGLGPVLGGVLIQAFDWSAVFWVNVPLGVFGVVVTLLGVRESRDPGARRLDPVGAVLVAAGLFLLTLGLVETNEHRWTSAHVVSLLVGGVALLALFLAWEHRVSHPMVPLSLFRDARFGTANAVYLLAYVALAGMFFFLTLYFQNVRGWSALKTGISWIPLNVPFLLITPFAPPDQRPLRAGQGERNRPPRGRRRHVRLRAADARLVVPRGVAVLRARGNRLRARGARSRRRRDGRRARRLLRRRVGDPQLLAPDRHDARARRPRLDQRGGRIARVGRPCRRPAARHPPRGRCAGPARRGRRGPGGRPARGARHDPPRVRGVRRRPARGDVGRRGRHARGCGDRLRGPAPGPLARSS